jgi:transcriptional regulator GlxA family with amidase domain
VLTSAGAAAGHDLCLHLIRRDFGADAAARSARLAVMPLERAGGQAQFIVHAPPSQDGSLGAVFTWVERHLHENLTLTRLARQAAMSTRTLSRRFREQAGTTPALWVARARVRCAQRLLETTKTSIEQVAAEAGFGSAAVMRERFQQTVGTSPRGYRQSFRRA